MCSELCSYLFHPTCSTLSAMPLTKVDDAERKRQGRAASPSERGRRSERAPSRSKAKNAERMRQERAQAAHFPQIRRVKLKARRRALLGSKLGMQTKRQKRAPSPPSSADATGWSSFNQDGKRPLTNTLLCNASGLAIAKGVFEDRNMERPTCACCSELNPPSRIPDANCEYRGQRQQARAHSQKAHLGAHHVCLLRRSHRHHQKAFFSSQGSFVGQDSSGS